MGKRLAALALVALSSAPAAAEDVQTVKQDKWYGLQVLGVDAAVFTIAAATRDGADGARIGLTWVVTGPAVHAAHGHVDRALGSLGMRIALPIIGAYVGSAADHCTSCQGDRGLVIGGGLGLVAAEVIDVLSANDEIEVPLRRDFVMAPVVRATSSDWSVGLAGQF